MDTKPIVGIIGYGVWGKTLEKIFTRQGYEVIVADKNTALAPKDVMLRADAVFFCLPIWETVSVMKKMMRYSREGQLLSDITSVKMLPMSAMSSSKATVIGLHPQGQVGDFGWNGLNVSVCVYRPSNWLPWILSVLERSGAKATVCTPDIHDHASSFFQCVLHAVLILIARIFRKNNIGPSEHRGFSTSLYRVCHALIGRVLAKDADLYSGIMMNNPCAIDALLYLERELQKMLRAVQGRKRKLFRSEFEKDVAHYNFPASLGVKGADKTVSLLLNLLNDIENPRRIWLCANEDRVGLCREIAEVCEKHGVSLERFHSFPHNGSFLFLVLFQPADPDVEKETLDEILRIKGVSLYHH